MVSSQNSFLLEFSIFTATKMLAFKNAYCLPADKTRTLLPLIQKQSLCMVTMILNVFLCAINWKACLLLLRLSYSVYQIKFLITYLPNGTRILARR